VHWHTVRHISRNADGTQHISDKLIKPDYWLTEESALKAAIQVNDLKAFMQKANFVIQSVTMFWLFTSTCAMVRQPDSCRFLQRKIPAKSTARFCLDRRDLYLFFLLTTE
jgi:hypothetical protein